MPKPAEVLQCFSKSTHLKMLVGEQLGKPVIYGGMCVTDPPQCCQSRKL